MDCQEYPINVAPLCRHEVLAQAAEAVEHPGLLIVGQVLNCKVVAQSIGRLRNKNKVILQHTTVPAPPSPPTTDLTTSHEAGQSRQAHSSGSTHAGRQAVVTEPALYA